MNDLLERAVEEVISGTQLQKLLKSKRPLRLKLGVDPSSPDIHLGHAVVLRKLRRFQELGHTVIFLIGDATARIGDPTGRNKTRPVLTEKEILANAQTYLDQVGQILDLEQAEIRRNSEWLDELTFSDLLSLAGNFTVSQLTEREDFQKRLAAGTELGLHELLYPVMQAYDSVMIKADVEFGGRDQRFNMLAGRALQKKMGQEPQQVFMSKILVGTDGKQKMSKSLGNYIALTDEPADMYGKVMRIPDQLIAEYYELVTDVDMKIVSEAVKTVAAGANPRDVKASLAREIVSIYHSPAAAEEAEASFTRIFREGGQPAQEQMHEIKLGKESRLIEVMVSHGAASSNSEVRRLIEQGGIKLNSQPVESESVAVKAGDVLQVGKRNFYKLS